MIFLVDTSFSRNLRVSFTPLCETSTNEIFISEDLLELKEKILARTSFKFLSIRLSTILSQPIIYRVYSYKRQV
jgi:hypothetical protein